MQLITTNEIIQINRTIHDMSHYNRKIEYVKVSDIKYNNLNILVHSAPEHDLLIDIATYYMKNIILMQCFPDANHRTAFEIIRLFYHKNDIDFKWNPQCVVKYQREIYKLRYRIYNSYEELSVSVLTEPHNKLWDYCWNCIMDNLS